MVGELQRGCTRAAPLEFTPMKSGVMPVTCMAFTMANHSQSPILPRLRRRLIQVNVKKGR